ncbi:MAG: sporulation protein YqfD [Christensenellales bacterium]
MNLTLELSGLNLERLLRTAGENGVRLRNVRRADERTMRVTVSATQKGKLAALCGRYGWQMTEVRADWPLRLIRTMKDDGRSARRCCSASFGSLSLPK